MRLTSFGPLCGTHPVCPITNVINTTGLVLLFALGNLHVSWTIWQMLLYVFDNEAAELVETSVLICWFVGVVGGAIFGAFLNSSWSKILIYVSEMKL